MTLGHNTIAKTNRIVSVFEKRILNYLGSIPNCPTGWSPVCWTAVPELEMSFECGSQIGNVRNRHSGLAPHVPKQNLHF